MAGDDGPRGGAGPLRLAARRVLRTLSGRGRAAAGGVADPALLEPLEQGGEEPPPSPSPSPGPAAVAAPWLGGGAKPWFPGGFEGVAPEVQRTDTCGTRRMLELSALGDEEFEGHVRRATRCAGLTAALALVDLALGVLALDFVGVPVAGLPKLVAAASAFRFRCGSPKGRADGGGAPLPRLFRAAVATLALTGVAAIWYLIYALLTSSPALLHDWMAVFRGFRWQHRALLRRRAFRRAMQGAAWARVVSNVASVAPQALGVWHTCCADRETASLRSGAGSLVGSAASFGLGGREGDEAGDGAADGEEAVRFWAPAVRPRM